MTIIEAALKLGLAPSTLRRQAIQGKLRATKHGVIWWTTDEDVALYAATRLGRPGRKASEK